MKSWIPIAVVLALVGGGGFLVYQAMYESVEETAPEDGAVEVPSGTEAAGAPSEQVQLQMMLDDTEWLVVSGYDHGALRERLQAAKVEMDPAAEAEVLRLLAAHMKTLRENLEAAHAATAGPSTAAERRRYLVAAAKAHGDFQRELRKIVSAETATAVFNAAPGMIPPTPTGD